MKEKMIEKINQRIKRMEIRFQETHKFSETDNAEIDGMIEMLKIVTGKDYYYNENGVYEMQVNFFTQKSRKYELFVKYKYGISRKRRIQ